MQIRELMTTKPISIHIDSTVKHAAEIISISGISDLMVVDHQNAFTGVLSENDLIQPLLPDLEDVIELGGSVEDALHFFKTKGTEYADYPIAPLVNKDPIVVKPSEEAFYAATILLQKKIRCLPVIERGDLAGTFCKTDVCRGMVYPQKKELLTVT